METPGRTEAYSIYQAINKKVKRNVIVSNRRIVSSQAIALDMFNPEEFSSINFFLYLMINKTENTGIYKKIDS